MFNNLLTLAFRPCGIATHPVTLVVFLKRIFNAGSNISLGKSTKIIQSCKMIEICNPIHVTVVETQYLLSINRVALCQTDFPIILSWLNQDHIETFQSTATATLAFQTKRSIYVLFMPSLLGNLALETQFSHPILRCKNSVINYGTATLLPLHGGVPFDSARSYVPNEE